MDLKELKSKFKKINGNIYSCINIEDVITIENDIKNFNIDANKINSIFIFNDDPSMSYSFTKTSNENINKRINNDFIKKISEDYNCSIEEAYQIYISGEINIESNNIGKQIWKDILKFDNVFDCRWGC